MKIVKAFALLLIAALAALAHVGSPDIYLDGQAGPYKLFITVRPPTVIPGVAEIEVRAQSAGVKQLTVVPVPLNRVGTKLAPVPDTLKVSPQDAQEFTGSLWIMTPGSWQVRIKATGSDGPGEVAVPVPAYALSTKKMGGGLGAILLLLTLLLAGGMVLIVGASVREGQLQPGARPEPANIRRSYGAMIKAGVVLGLVLAFGFWWWGSAERDYRDKIYKPLNMAASLNGGELTLTLSDPGWLNLPGQRLPRLSPAVFVRTIDDLVPDHNHLMHLYAIREPGLDEVYHLHPQQTSAGVFRLGLPAMKPGLYRLYADIVHANGFPETPVAQVTIPEGLKGRPLEGDDASGSATPWENAPVSNDFVPASRRLHDGMGQAGNAHSGSRREPLPFSIAWSRREARHQHALLHGHAGPCGVRQDGRDSVRAYSPHRIGFHGIFDACRKSASEWQEAGRRHGQNGHVWDGYARHGYEQNGYERNASPGCSGLR